MITNPFVSLSAVLCNFRGRTVTSLERNLAHHFFISSLTLTPQVSCQEINLSLSKILQEHATDLEISTMMRGYDDGINQL